jgi:hypothetical protein
MRAPVHSETWQKRDELQRLHDELDLPVTRVVVEGPGR